MGHEIVGQNSEWFHSQSWDRIVLNRGRLWRIEARSKGRTDTEREPDDGEEGDNFKNWEESLTETRDN